VRRELLPEPDTAQLVVFDNQHTPQGNNTHIADFGMRIADRKADNRSLRIVAPRERRFEFSPAFQGRAKFNWPLMRPAWLIDAHLSTHRFFNPQSEIRIPQSSGFARGLL
jgi:hypothetical protein